MGEVLLRDATAAERMGGDDFTLFGAANEATKKSDNKTDHGLRG